MIAVVAGTRPESIKMAPVVRALRRAGLSAEIVLVRQHPELATAALAEFSLSPDRECGAPPRDGVVDFVGRALPELAEVFRLASLVLVQGDTATALAGTLAAHAAHVPVGHVEAGLRTADPWEPWPEEWNRRLIDHGSQMWFAPTWRALDHLRAEGLGGELTGNTGIDALLWMREMLPQKAAPALFDLPGILVSLHRREAWGEPLRRAMGAVRRLAEEWPVVILHHPSPAVEEAVRPLRGCPGVRVVEPQDYATVIRALADCRLVLTDSGGLQEEAPALGKPVLVVRALTERMEVVEAGMGEVVGHDPVRIVGAVRRWAAPGRTYAPAFPFGDGTAAVRIAESVARFVER